MVAGPEADIYRIGIAARPNTNNRPTADISAARKQTLQPHDSGPAEQHHVFGNTVRLVSPDQFEKMQMSLR